MPVETTRCDHCASRSECAVGRLPAPQRSRLAPLIEERPFHKGQVLQRQGEKSQTIGIVKVGTILLSRQGADGRARPVGIFGSGHLLGSVGLFGEANVTGIEALAPGRVCQFPLAPLLQEQMLDATFSFQVAAAWARSYEELADWAQVMRVRGVAGQVAATLLQLSRMQRSRLVRLPSHSLLAELLGTTRETVARALSDLHASHCLVRRDRWHCEIAKDGLVTRIAATL